MADTETNESVSMFNKSSAYKIRISDDFMTAWMRLEPLPDGALPDADDCRNALRNAGIKQGIITENLNKVINNCLYYQEYLIAEGRAAVDGADGFFEFLVNTQVEAKPTELPDGSVDYSNIELFIPVEKGQLLVRYHAATAGNFGFLINGQLMNPKRGKDLVPMKGKGFELSEDQKDYTAAYDGYVDCSGGQLNVSRVFTVKGDLDMTVGNIHFSGDVEIKGDVAKGMLVEAGGSVIIGGHVGGASIVAGENIILKGGMQGEGIGRLKAGGNIEGKFVEASQIICNGDLMANYLLNCKAKVNGRITIAGRKGAVIGGNVQAIRGITAAEIGNPAELPTVVIAGPGEEINQQLTELKKQLCKVDEELLVLSRGKQQIEESPQPIRDRNQSIYEKTIQAINMKQAEREETLQRERELSNLVFDGQRARIVVTNLVYAGVTATVFMKSCAIKSSYHNVSFAILDDQISILQNI